MWSIVSVEQLLSHESSLFTVNNIRILAKFVSLKTLLAIGCFLAAKTYVGMPMFSTPNNDCF